MALVPTTGRIHSKQIHLDSAGRFIDGTIIRTIISPIIWRRRRRT
jgi:hypothetical protein